MAASIHFPGGVWGSANDSIELIALEARRAAERIDRRFSVTRQLNSFARANTVRAREIDQEVGIARRWLSSIDFSRNWPRYRKDLDDFFETPLRRGFSAYIDFEISEGAYERTRQLYDRLLDRTKHLKVWISYAKFEASIAMEEEDQDTETKSKDDAEHRMECIQRCRGVFERAFDYLRTSAPELKEERAMLLEEWLNKERNFGSLGDVSIVQKKLPRKVKRKRAIQSDDGNPAGYEEYIDYIFPDEVAMAPNLKILEAAYKWKKQKAGSDED